MALIMDGKPVGIEDDRVYDDIVFTPGINKNTKSHRGVPWHGLAIHWTGGERGYNAVADTLAARNLSIHFVCESDGRLVQTADLSTRCAHIGSPGNDRFLGVETICRGFATPDDWVKAKQLDPTLREREDIDWETPRDVYRDKIGDNYANFAGFNREQLISLIWLAETLASVCDYPRQIPARVITAAEVDATNWPFPNVADYLVDYDGRIWMPDFSRDATSHPVKSRAGKWRGVLGHFHVHRHKMDPGTQIMYALWAEGWNPANKKLPNATTL